ncbi:MAG: BamA/TamA family outer membrane protein [Pseudomonadota bacterium]
MRRRFLLKAINAWVAAGALLLAPAAHALDRVEMSAPGAPDDLVAALQSASLVVAARRAGTTRGDEVLAAAQADYARLVAALYEDGRFGATVSILVDGREAATIDPLNAPDTVGTVSFRIVPGPVYSFSRADIAPLATGTVLPEGFRTRAPARTPAIRAAAGTATDAWRDVGHAKATIADQSITADHADQTIDTRLRVDPGPELRFGRLIVSGNKDVRTDRIVEIASLPGGRRFDPAETDRVIRRLRETGTFRSVSLTEADTANPDGTLDMSLEVAEQLPRRFGFGAELSTVEGITLSGFWLHRNLLGGAERLRFDGELGGIGGDTGGEDYTLGVRYERPATFGSDTVLGLFAEIEQANEPEFTSSSFSLGASLERRLTDDLPIKVGITYATSEVTDASGTERYRQLFFPVSAVQDRRESPLDTNDGYYIAAEIAPFLGLSDSESGTRTTLDARGYRSFSDNRFVLAGRLQYGGIFGASITGLPNDMRFTSGGGGTVRGQEYQSLQIDLGGGLLSGGRSFLGLATEVRTRVRDNIQLVTFFDWGQIGPDSFPDGDSHSGAGLGLRYDTGIGPIRLDVGVPVSGPGDTSGFELYIGIGQAF